MKIIAAELIFSLYLWERVEVRAPGL